MISGKLDGMDGNYAKESSKSPILHSKEEEQPLNEYTLKEWRDYTPKGFMFLTKSFTMFNWDGINFKLHGFWLAMVGIDMLWSMVSSLSLSWLLLALLRNTFLFFIIFGLCFLRITIFGKKRRDQSHSVQLTFGDIDSIVEQEDDDNEEVRDDDEESDDMINLGDDGFGFAIIGNSESKMHATSKIDSKPAMIEHNENEIEIKSVIITYLGGIITLKSMSKSIMKQCQYFSFFAFAHFALAILFWLTSNEQTKWLFSWLKNANFYCMIMCLLPVPGFDGAALLTIYLRHKQWPKFSISAILLASSCVITIFCGVLAVFKIDIVALYLAIYCGFKTIQFVANPKDENMKVLKTMAQAATSANDKKRIMTVPPMATNMV